MMLERVRRARVVRQAGKRSGYLVRDHLRLLYSDNKQLHRELKAKRLGFTPSGRYVCGRMLSFVLLGYVLLAGVAWWAYAGDAAVLKEAVREGRPAMLVE